MYVFVNKSGTDLTPHTIINDISTARDVLKPFDTFHYFPAPGENSVKLQFNIMNTANQNDKIVRGSGHLQFNFINNTMLNIVSKKAHIVTTPVIQTHDDLQNSIEAGQKIIVRKNKNIKNIKNNKNNKSSDKHNYENGYSDSDDTMNEGDYEIATDTETGINYAIGCTIVHKQIGANKNSMNVTIDPILSAHFSTENKESRNGPPVQFTSKTIILPMINNSAVIVTVNYTQDDKPQTVNIPSKATVNISVDTGTTVRYKVIKINKSHNVPKYPPQLFSDYRSSNDYTMSAFKLTKLVHDAHIIE
ncbi:MAG: hypothetical protein Terrestrivirus9_23 [Terrestrivirus sp.]|uniref:Uncharacterized protein n=1 Tax=Terrestrivirus sp. TaxID=2487775 RepID=A0A3G4ZNX8_9VIRU|nr:MAG: hypothetical protein Terrestrivirus9_23 [Terrestrivirus sp.]